MIYGRDYAATWIVQGRTVVITSSLGEIRAPLGGLATSPAIVASEALRERAMQGSRPAKAKVDRARFNVRDA